MRALLNCNCSGSFQSGAYFKTKLNDIEEFMNSFQKVLQDEETVQDLEINIYPDEFDFFCTLANKIFGI